MISEIEKTVALRYLKPKRKEGFLKIISLFSFLGISLGVAVLIIVMSVMNGFRAELIDKILGFNAHIIVKPNEEKIETANFFFNRVLPRVESYYLTATSGSKYIMDFKFN